MIDEVNPPEAWDMLVSNPQAILLDVRSRMEFEYVGRPLGAINIPWKEPPGWEVDPEFVNIVRSVISELRPGTDRIEDLPILALCRSGARSQSAGEALQKQGFTQVYNIVEGFEGDRDENKHRGTINGWRMHKLPWEQS